VGSVENAEANAESCISLPIFPELTEAEVDYSIQKVFGMGQGQRIKKYLEVKLTCHFEH